mmetsp:Transcript_42988/g.118905  ORF Transcript_42988/g.118905 Transcript_42988/m.118905 type:complete len:100 (-) Transcript_42988:97-396(-)
MGVFPDRVDKTDDCFCSLAPSGELFRDIREEVACRLFPLGLGYVPSSFSSSCRYDSLFTVKDGLSSFLVGPAILDVPKIERNEGSNTKPLRSPNITMAR